MPPRLVVGGQGEEFSRSHRAAGKNRLEAYTAGDAESHSRGVGYHIVDWLTWPIKFPSISLVWFQATHRLGIEGVALRFSEGWHVL